MTNLTDELVVRSVMAEREEEAKSILRAAAARRGRRGLRAGWAARLVRLGLRLDREAALSRLWPEGPAPAAKQGLTGYRR